MAPQPSAGASLPRRPALTSALPQAKATVQAETGAAAAPKRDAAALASGETPSKRPRPDSAPPNRIEGDEAGGSSVSPSPSPSVSAAAAGQGAVAPMAIEKAPSATGIATAAAGPVPPAATSIPRTVSTGDAAHESTPAGSPATQNRGWLLQRLEKLETEMFGSVRTHTHPRPQP